MILRTLRMGSALIVAGFCPSPLLAQAPRASVLVSTDWLAGHLNDPGLIVLHVAGQRSDYEAGHVPGARFIASSSYTTQRDSLSTEFPDEARLDSLLESLGVSDNSRIVIAGGPVTLSARLYVTLDYFGLGDHASLLDGGIDAWREENRLLSRSVPDVTRGTLTLHRMADRVVDAPWIVRNTEIPGAHIAVIDARVPDFYMGLAVNNTPRAGRLPTAENVPFSWLTGELGRFRDRKSLERLFTQAGVKKNDKVVTYCHIGIQASVAYVAARLLGFDAAIYDGSFEDWSRRLTLPIGTGPRVP